MVGQYVKRERKKVDTRSVVARARFSSFKAAGLLLVVLSRWPTEPGLHTTIPEMEKLRSVKFQAKLGVASCIVAVVLDVI